MIDVLISVIVMLLMILLSAFLAAAEVSLVSIGKIRVRTLAKSLKSGSQNLERLKRNQRQAIITILIGNNLVNTFASVLATVISLQLFGELGVGIAIAVMSIIIIVVGDILPKTFASVNAEPIALFCAPVLEFFVYLLSPIVKLLNWVSEVLFKLSKKDVSPMITEKEIHDIIAIGVEEKVLEHHEREFIERVLLFNDIPVKNIMISKDNMVTIASSATVDEAFIIANMHAHFRFPVVNQDNQIIGTARLKDILKYVKKDDKKLITDLMHPPLFIQSDTMIDQVFREMQARKLHMGYVVNHNNELIGLITIADLIEELVGDVDI
ncbi:MAG: hemolysin family protein [Candidatus Micrarchaeota archaeon]|nr:hemolysin family protein [Candidatus Micrarchaeota archaeon]